MIRLLLPSLIFMVVTGTAAIIIGTVDAGSPDVMMQAQLNQEFQHLNDGYFDGALPRTAVRFEPTPDKNCIGETLYNAEGKRFEIYVNPKFNNDISIAKETVIHETCHVAEWGHDDEGDHGPSWQTCMKNLANEGAFEGIW